MKRGPYQTQAPAAGDDAVALRLQMLDAADDDTWERFCRQTLGDWQGTRPHANRRVEQEAVLLWWRERGSTIDGATAKFIALETGWSAEPQRILFLSRYRIGASFAPTFYDELVRGPWHQPPFTGPPADADWRAGDPFPPMVRSGPLAPPTVIAELRLLLAFVEWLGQRRRSPAMIENPDAVRQAVLRGTKRRRTKI